MNYISQFVSDNTVCSIYHSKIFFLGAPELTNLVSANYSQCLRSRIKYQGMIEDTHADSSFSVPFYVDSNRLIESIRSICGKALIFINVWMSETEYPLLNVECETYKDFFSKSLSYILSIETNEEIISTVVDLKKSLEEIYEYLGYYQGDFSGNICSAQEAVTSILFLVFMTSI